MTISVPMHERRHVEDAAAREPPDADQLPEVDLATGSRSPATRTVQTMNSADQDRDQGRRPGTGPDHASRGVAARRCRAARSRPGGLGWPGPSVGSRAPVRYAVRGEDRNERAGRPSAPGPFARRRECYLAALQVARGLGQHVGGKVHVGDGLEDLGDGAVGQVVVDVGGDRRVRGGLGLVDVDVEAAGERVGAVAIVAASGATQVPFAILARPGSPGPCPCSPRRTRSPPSRARCRCRRCRR